MRYASGILLFAMLCTFAIAQEETPKPSTDSEEQKDLTAMLDAYLNQQEILPKTRKVQEYVEIASEKYPGLDVHLSTPADLASAYRPNKKDKFLESDFMMLSRRLYDYELSGTARPHNSGRLFDVTLPD